MSQKTSDRRAAQLIKEIRNHSHQHELLQLMEDQLKDELSFSQSICV